MQTIFEEIERALAGGIHYAAISLALSIPDVCASLQHPVGHVKGSNKAGYMKWFIANLGPDYPEITGNDIYALRSGVVHNGRFGAGKSFSRIVFIIRVHPERPLLHRCTSRDVYQLDSETFCRNMIDAAKRWLSNNSNDANVRRNLDRVVMLRPTGLVPHFVGMPLIA